MTIHYDEKGKFFTEVIRKNAMQVVIQTAAQRIEGKVHVRDGQRLIDELGESGDFIAVTDAVVYGAGEEPLYRCGFMTVNRSHVVWIIPQEEIGNSHRHAGGEL